MSMSISTGIGGGISKCNPESHLCSASSEAAIMY